MNHSNSLELTIIGSGAVRVHPDRGGTSACLRMGNRTILIDCGRCAVQNLVRFGIPVESVTDILLTHLHFDHVCDLAQLLLLSWNNGRAWRMPIIGPVGTRNFLEHNLRQAYVDDLATRIGKNQKDPDHFEWDVTEIGDDGTVMQTDQFRIVAGRTPHTGMEAFNFRIEAGDRRIVITSDTEWHDGLVEFCSDAEVLVIECSGTEEFLKTVPWGGWHMTPQRIAILANEALVKTVVLKHLAIESFVDDPEIGERMADDVRKSFDGSVEVARDGRRFSLPIQGPIP
ncbi:MAG: hypothetical protein DRP71_17810 [Verrucomicrobia bacterium]|nr:MAG: hypothetical protein DRP71_17810 [Verrucomicrobiota bacterium]